ncbi:MAG: PucR family transcriptional regulator ligand-binding domain-containing protein [Bacillota bacterium]|nr:PucR family transcriptional regulator ligand-binding domain-containing protein [Bacillota bacterium]
MELVWMSITVAEALKMEVFKDCRLLTGQAGLTNEILWVNILEILDDLSHIEPGEFLITTAHDFNSHSISMQQGILEFFAAKKLAAMAIQTGHYLKEIPSTFIHFSEEYKLPLIEIPPDVSFKTLTRALLNELVQTDQKSAHKPDEYSANKQIELMIDDMKKLWNQLIMDDNPEETMLDMERYNISYHEPIMTFALSIGPPGNPRNELQGDNRQIFLSQLEFNAARILLHYYTPYIMGQSDYYTCFMVQGKALDDDPGASRNSIIYRLIEEIKFLFPEYIIITGCSGIHANLLELKQAKDEAEKALQAGLLGLADRSEVIMYKKLGLFRLILDTKNPETLKKLYHETIGPLIDYDLRCKGSLVHTLQSYIKHCNIQKSSEELFIHRHTMRYRLEQINLLTGYNPLLPSDLLQLTLGFYILKYLAALNLVDHYQASPIL